MNQARVCSRHFIAGKSASLDHELNSDWLPTQNLVHAKCSKRVFVRSERYARKRARFARALTSTASVSPVNYGGLRNMQSVVYAMLRFKLMKQLSKLLIYELN